MTLTNLRALTRFFALGSRNTSSDFDDTSIDAQLNSNYNQLVVLAFASSGDWQTLGNNKAQTSITAATRSYSLPTGFLRINRVEIKYPATASDYVRATQIDYKSISPNGLDDYSPSRPQFDLKEDKFEIFVSNKTADITAVTNGINVYYEDEITELAAVDSEPVIAEPFSRLLCLMSARDYCGVNSLNTRLSWLTGEIEKEKAAFAEFYANRSTAKRLSLRPRREDYGTGDLMHGSGLPSKDWS